MSTRSLHELCWGRIQRWSKIAFLSLPVVPFVWPVEYFRTGHSSMCSEISDVTLTEIERMEYRVERLPPAVKLMLVSRSTFVPSSVNDFFIDVAARFEVTDAHRTLPSGVLRHQRESIS